MKFATNHAAGQANHPQVHNRIGRALNYRTYTTLADDTMTAAELQAACDEGGVIAIPPGTHTLDAPVTVGANVIAIEGNGAILSGGGLVLDCSSGSIRHLRISDLTISGGAVGILCTGSNVVSQCQFDNVVIYGQSSTAFKADCEFYVNTFTGCHFHTADYAVWLADDCASTVNRFQTCRFSLSRECAVFVDKTTDTSAAAGLTFADCTFEGNRKHAVKATRLQNARFESCHFESNNLDKIGAADVHLSNAGEHFPCEFIQFVNCRWHFDQGSHIEQPQVGIRLGDTVRNVSIDTCKLMNAARTGGVTLDLGTNADTLITNTPLP